MGPPYTYVIGLGANLGHRERNLGLARVRMAALPLPQLGASSPRYQSVALGPPPPDYLNAAVRLESALPPPTLLQELPLLLLVA